MLLLTTAILSCDLQMTMTVAALSELQSIFILDVKEKKKEKIIFIKCLKINFTNFNLL